jgi:hypothetical protein
MEIVGIAALLACAGDAKTVRLTTKPAFIVRESATEPSSLIYLVLRDSTDHFEMLWATSVGSQIFHMPVTLDTAETYTFTIGDTRNWPNARSVLRIEHGGDLMYDIGVCPVHKTAMALERQEIVYGLFALREPDSLGRHRFPNRRRDYIQGGCSSSANDPKTGNAYVCSQCEAAYAAWLTEHGSTK